MRDTPDIPSPMAAALDRTDLSKSARLVYGALRLADGPRTRRDLGELTGLTKPTVKRVTEELVAADWVTTDIRSVPRDGPDPKTYRPLVPCPDPECDERFVGEQSVYAHYGHAHQLTATDLIGRAGEQGADPSPPPRPEAEDG
jgi:hypothetical protein